MPDRLMLLDSASLYFRAFYGVPDSVKAPDGTPVNAVRGFLDIITKLVTTYRPTHLVACWDDDWRPQWRVDLIPSYKTHRVAEVIDAGPDIEVVPDPLEAQVPIIRETLAAVGIPIVGATEHEADDVIGTLATTASLPVDIVTGDRDLFQLVDDARDVRVVYTARGMSNLEVITDEVVVRKYGVLPSQYADFATMRGDSSDGLPGVAGIGEKSAATLLAAHGDLAGIIAAAEAGQGMSAGVAAKITTALPYLAVAPTVVEVVRDLDLPDVDSRLRPLDERRKAHAAALAERWGIGSAMTRIVEALATTA
ncbi:5'-3' exonuclease H3TH domain-containing protein [Microbacterium sp. BK668]|uniref:5'-3' exonuclease n=1 Tax=Microbacterium sp. BK668 TaxID=2512118 RepID=UPI00105C5E2F|nr:5'-3' exonuclease H3TH domain-containing protein [Microbacterium sp. BK668]TDN93153.1 5'-3' exonuclease [Microbacterium sp. BK668]